MSVSKLGVEGVVARCRPSVAVAGLLPCAVLFVATMLAAQEQTVKVLGGLDEVEHHIGRSDFYLLCRSDSYLMFRALSEAFQMLTPEEQGAFESVADELTLPVASFDTYHEGLHVPASLADEMESGEGPLVVQFHWSRFGWLPCGEDRSFGTEWLGGSWPLYHGGRLLWTTADERTSLLERVWEPEDGDVTGSGSEAIQFASPFHPYFKARPELWSLGDSETLEERVVVRRWEGLPAFEAWLESVAEAPTTKSVSGAGLVRYDVALERAHLDELARVRSVLAVGEGPDGGPLRESHDSYLLTARTSHPLPLADGAAALLYDDGARKVLRVSENRLNATSHALLQGLSVQSEEVGIVSSIHSGKLDEIPAELLAPDPGELARLQIVQMLPGSVGPIPAQPEGAPEDRLDVASEGGGPTESPLPLASFSSQYASATPWIQQLASLGQMTLLDPPRVVLWIEPSQLDALDDLTIPQGLFSSPNASAPARFVVAHEILHPFFKVIENALGPETQHVQIRLFPHDDVEETIDLIDQLSLTPVSMYTFQGLYARAELTAADRLTVMRRRDVVTMYPSGGSFAWPGEEQTLSAPAGEIAPAAGERMRLATYAGRDFFRMTLSGVSSLPWNQRVLLNHEHDVVSLPPGESLHPPSDPLPADLPLERADGFSLRVVQFQDSGYAWHDPNQRPWFGWPDVLSLQRVWSGAEVVWTDAAGAATLAAMTSPFGVFEPPPQAQYPLKFHSVLFPAWKHGDLTPGVRYYAASIVRNPEIEDTLDLFRSLSPGAVLVAASDPHRVTASGWLDLSGALSLVQRSDVYRWRIGSYGLPSGGLGAPSSPAPPGILSIGDTVRVLAPAGLLVAATPGVQLLGELLEEGSEVREEVRLAASVLNTMSPVDRDLLEVLNDDISFNGYHFDSQDEWWQIPGHQLIQPAEDTLVVIQLIDSRPGDWQELVEATGARIVAQWWPYANKTFLLWADESQVAALQQLAVPEPFAEPSSGEFLQYLEPHHPYFRVRWWVHALPPSEYLPIYQEIRLAEHEEFNADTGALIRTYFPWADQRSDTLWGVDLEEPADVAALLEIVRRPDVVQVGYDPPGPSGFGPPGDPIPGPPGAAEIPTLSGVALVALFLLLGLAGLSRLRRGARARVD